MIAGDRGNGLYLPLPLLESPYAHSMSASKTNDTSTLLLKVSSLQAELSHLQRRYDALLASKERAASRYKADYKKWRDFKLWLSKNFNCDKEIHFMLKDTDSGVDRTPSGINKRRKLDGMGPPPSVFDHTEEMSNTSALTRTRAGFHPSLVRQN